MSETSQVLYQNENRSITITVLDQDHIAFTSIMDTSTFRVTDGDGETVVSETSATVSDNTLTAVIGTTVTSTVGDYYIIWKIVDNNGYIYYHKTYLQVLSLLGS